MSDSSANHDTLRRWLAGLGFGAVFGFLLQKGGVGKYHILMGQLLFEDWTVVKVMLTAIVVGMVGVHVMKRRGLVEPQLKKTVIVPNLVGGLVFGVGFGLSAYCPGTNLAALGQGNWDALAVVAGLLAGSHLFAECSGWLGRHPRRRGDRGELSVARLIRRDEGTTVALLAVVLVSLLVIIEIRT
jgi:uncharacterized membrane protein YedE/YeeE